jgi:hypothetical protein
MSEDETDNSLWVERLTNFQDGEAPDLMLIKSSRLPLRGSARYEL